MPIKIDEFCFLEINFKILVKFIQGILLLILFSNIGFAQNIFITDNQNIYWTRYHVTGTINSKFNIQFEADNRVFISNLKQQQFISHLHLHYKVNAVNEFAIGLSHSRISAQFDDATNVLTIPENRIFQEYYFRKPINSKWQFQNRVRTEQRFFRNFEANELVDGYNFNWRVREQISISYLIHPNFRLKFNDEIMFNFGKSIVYNRFDQNRVYTGIEFIPNKNISGELGYMKLIQKRNNPTDFFNRDVIRLSIFHKFDFKK